MLAGLAAAAFLVSSQVAVASAKPAPEPTTAPTPISTPHAVAPEITQQGSAPAAFVYVPDEHGALQLAAVEYAAVTGAVDPGQDLSSIEPTTCHP